ncbi:MAG: hypothetical protein WCQ50_15585 [Spirochaetota bacterium]
MPALPALAAARAALAATLAAALILAGSLVLTGWRPSRLALVAVVAALPGSAPSSAPSGLATFAFFSCLRRLGCQSGWMDWWSW